MGFFRRSRLLRTIKPPVRPGWRIPPAKSQKLAPGSSGPHQKCCGVCPAR